MLTLLNLMLYIDMYKDQFQSTENEVSYQGQEISNHVNSIVIKLIESNTIDTIVLVFALIIDKIKTEEQERPNGFAMAYKLKGII